MNDFNTLSKKAYVCDHLYYLFASFVCFKVLLFRSIGFHSRAASMIILWSLILTLNIIGIKMCWNKHRNNMMIFSNVCIPFGIYTLLTYYKNFPILWSAVVIVAIILSSIFCLLILRQKIKRQSCARKIIKRRLSRCFIGVWIIVSVCLSTIVLPLGASVVFRNTLISSNTSAEAPGEDNRWTIENNIETVMNLRDEKWTKLSTKEKLNTMQAIANIEATYLGLPHELNVTLGTLSEYTIAGYMDSDHTIIMNIDYFESYSAPEALDALCHEAYHAFQRRLCDAYNSVDETFKDLRTFRSIQQYEYEFGNYMDGEDDFDRYYFQACEHTSRTYAENAVKDYYDRINKHLTDNGQAEPTKGKEKNT